MHRLYYCSFSKYHSNKGEYMGGFLGLIYSLKIRKNNKWMYYLENFLVFSKISVRLLTELKQIC